MKTPARRAIAMVVLIAALLVIPALPAMAAEPHQDPAAVPVLFSPVSLLQYYSETQDYLLRRDAPAVAARLEKIPFANIPAVYEEPISSLNRSEVELVSILVRTDDELRNLDALVSQYRYDEAISLYQELLAEIARGAVLVNRIRQDVGRIGLLAGVRTVAEESRLAVTYRELTAKVDKKQEVLNRSLLVAGQYAELKPRRQTTVTLRIDPLTAFVGDTVDFSGSLTAGEDRLSNRQINILLNGTPYVSVFTDESGNYNGTLQVPYEYIPYLNLEALYVPEGDDRGIYRAAKSPAVRLRVLFYSAVLTLKLPDKAHPGRDMSVEGVFKYVDAPVPDARTLEIYFDDNLIGRTEVGQDFAVKVTPPVDAQLGKHTVAVLAPPAGRYAPVRAGGYVDIVRATPVIRLDIPAAAFFPGVVHIGGQVLSDLGPAAGAGVSITIGESLSQDTTSPDGSFNLRFGRGPGLELLGSQTVKVAVTPVEPWHSTASATGNIIVVNWLNLAGIIGLIAVLGVALRRRLRGFVLNRPQFAGRRAVPPMPTTPPAIIVEETKNAAEHPPHRLITWYRRTVAIIQRVIGVAYTPQQTMREYLALVLPRLGPAGSIFAELTYKVERLLYSSWEPTAEESSRLDGIARQLEGHLGNSS